MKKISLESIKKLCFNTFNLHSRLKVEDKKGSSTVFENYKAIPTIRYSYLSKILTLKLSDSCKEMFRETAILYHEKKTVFGCTFFFFNTFLY